MCGRRRSRDTIDQTRRPGETYRVRAWVWQLAVGRHVPSRSAIVVPRRGCPPPRPGRVGVLYVEVNTRVPIDGPKPVSVLNAHGEAHVHLLRRRCEAHVQPRGRRAEAPYVTPGLFAVRYGAVGSARLLAAQQLLRCTDRRQSRRFEKHKRSSSSQPRRGHPQTQQARRESTTCSTMDVQYLLAPGAGDGSVQLTIIARCSDGRAWHSNARLYS